MTRWKGAAVLAVITAVLLYAIQLMPSEPVPATPVMGIVSTASEDDRREAQVRALVQAAEADGFEVLSMPVERTQEAQIEAIRALIVYQADVIVFTPLVESGWENVLREANEAGVPVIAVDKSVRGDGFSISYVGFDYTALAEQAAQALLRLHPPRRGVLELYGTLNASDAREIARGCREALTAADLRVTYSLCGDGMRSRGYEILESLSEHLDEIGCIFAHNDAMARGAVDYLHEHGRVPGRDILVCSFGGGADMRALLNDGMVQVVAALDDETLAALTVEAARGTVRAPAARFTYFAPAAVLEGGAGHAGT